MRKSIKMQDLWDQNRKIQKKYLSNSFDGFYVPDSTLIIIIASYQITI